MDRPFAEYWFDYFRAYEHFVPIQADASDFARQVQWMDENPAQCEAMARRAFERAAEVLGPDRVLSDARWMLVTFMRAVGYEPPTPTLAQLTAEGGSRCSSIGLLALAFPELSVPTESLPTDIDLSHLCTLHARRVQPE